MNKIDKLAFWLKYHNNKVCVCSNCRFTTLTAVEVCPKCKRTMVNVGGKKQ